MYCILCVQCACFVITDVLVILFFAIFFIAQTNLQRLGWTIVDKEANLQQLKWTIVNKRG
jgi:hypothetical protein